MMLRYRFALGGFLSCCALFWMSGAPLERGWGLWAAGVGTILITLMSLAVGAGIERGTKEDDDE